MEKIEIHKVHSLFEQSGIFKRESVKIGSGRPACAWCKRPFFKLWSIRN